MHKLSGVRRVRWSQTENVQFVFKRNAPSEWCGRDEGGRGDGMEDQENETRPYQRAGSGTQKEIAEPSGETPVWLERGQEDDRKERQQVKQSD